jgi:hypothetical protein
MDKNFCAESQTDKSKAWDKFLSKNCILGNGPRDPFGTKEPFIEALVGFYKLESLHFVWEPVHGFISDDETLGVTTGTYKRSYILNGEKQEQQGKYCTTWIKEEGTWKIIYDVGN